MRHYKALRRRFPKNGNYSITEFLMVCPFSLDELMKPNRKKEIKEWRQVGMVWKYLECENLSMAGRFFQRDHATVIHSIKLSIDAMDGYHSDLKEKIMMVADNVYFSMVNPKFDDMNEVQMLVSLDQLIKDKL